ncbi:MAG TPA: hypothetical protein VIU13_03210 [Chryseolinea sp.]
MLPNKYVADVGFAIRKDASGGGAVLNSESMKILGDIGMDIYFSEYRLTNTLKTYGKKQNSRNKQ